MEVGVGVREMRAAAAAAAQSKITNCKSSECIFDGDTETKRRHKPRDQERDKEREGERQGESKHVAPKCSLPSFPPHPSPELFPSLTLPLFRSYSTLSTLKLNAAASFLDLQALHPRALSLFPARTLPFSF